MKKIFLIISLFIIMTVSVSAGENKLYFTEKDDRIYYDSELIDEDVFLKHISMVPGDSYVDQLIIENGTKTKYTLFFKVVPREQSLKADELLENVFMKITLDGNLVYDGKATGLDYDDQGINLQDAILLGDFRPSQYSTMVVETYLSDNYDDTEFDEMSYIDWSFYAQYEGKQPTHIDGIPNTAQDSSMFRIILSIVVLLVGFSLMKILFKAKVNN